jgi:lysophospholipase L1-like esterase
MKPITAYLKAKKVEKKNKFGYNLNNGLFNYRVALSNVQNQVVRVYCIGDSITRGEYASNEPTKSWVGQLRTGLQSQYGGSGEGFIGAYEASLPAPVNRWTLGAGWEVMASNGGMGNYWIDNVSATNVAATSIPFNGTSVRILYAKTIDGGTADIKVDGVSKGTVDCHVLSGTDFSKYFDVTGLASGAHTLTITPTGNGKVFFEGIIEGGAASSGIHVYRMGRSSWKVSDWANGGSAQPRTFQRWGSLPPNLAIIALGMNDVKTVDVNTYKTNMGILISQLKSIGASVVILAYFQPSSGWVANSTWESYVNAMYSLADQYDCGLIDMYAAWGKSYTTAQSLGLFGPATNDYSGSSGTNIAHPGDKGYNYIAQTIKPYLI